MMVMMVKSGIKIHMGSSGNEIHFQRPCETNKITQQTKKLPNNVK